jgi:hypothetical protein
MFKNTRLYEWVEKALAWEGREDEIFQLALDNRTIRDLIVFMNTEDQLGEDHVNSKGEELFNIFTQRTTYSLFDKKGRGGKPYELKDTGEFWRSFKAKVGRGFIVITSDPFKGEDNIFEAYGNDVEGLTEENLEALITQAHEFFIRWIKQNFLPQ